MRSLFDSGGGQAVLDRLECLQPGAARLWGRMSAGQMLTHSSVALEMATGEQPRKQKMIGRILGPFFKKKLLGEEPFSRDSPTDPAFIVTDERNFAAEKSASRASSAVSAMKVRIAHPAGCTPSSEGSVATSGA